MSARRWHRLASFACRPQNSRLAIGGGIELLTTGGSGTAVGCFVLRRNRGNSSPSGQPTAIEPIPMELPGCVAWGSGKITTLIDTDAPSDETIDLDRLIPSLFVRAPVPGDRFEPLGMNGRSTSLNDFLRGRNIAAEDRARIPCSAMRPASCGWSATGLPTASSSPTRPGAHSTCAGKRVRRVRNAASDLRDTVAYGYTLSLIALECAHSCTTLSASFRNPIAAWSPELAA